MPHMSLQSLHLFGHGVEVFSIILLPRGLHSPKSGTGKHNRFKAEELQLQQTKRRYSTRKWPLNQMLQNTNPVRPNINSCIVILWPDLSSGGTVTNLCKVDLLLLKVGRGCFLPWLACLMYVQCCDLVMCLLCVGVPVESPVPGQDLNI